MTPPDTIRLYGTAPDSIVDGPGLRYAVFVQGCSHGCPGCHNPDSQPCAVNDLYYNGKKVCGILTEAGADIESGQLEWLVVGIGLNLTSRPEDWPEELRPIAGSLYPGGPAPVSRAALAGAIARELLGLCPAFDCLDEYRARCFVPGHWVTVCTGTESYAAKAVAIDDAGRLIVQREGGRTEALCHGEVSIRPSPLAVK